MFIALQLWYSIVNKNDDQGNSCDYLDLLNSWIPNKWFQISWKTGFRIQGRLRRKASSVVSKYRKATGSSKKKNSITTTILVSELVSVGKIEDDLHQANLAIAEWHKKCGDLQKEKEDLLKEIAEVTESKDAEIDSLNREICEYTQKISDLSDATLPNYGKTIDKLRAFTGGERQRARSIKELKGRADVALWFLESHGVTLTGLKVKETDSGKTCTYEYAEENITQQDDENLEQLLFLLDKFCVSDELYHKLTILYKDLPRSYLIKQMRSDLTKLCHIEKAREKAPGIYPGAQIYFWIHSKNT